MQLNERIQAAVNLASRLHAGQSRKADAGLPYISHPFSVAWMLNSYGASEDAIVAGLLHDVLEDASGYAFSDLARDFGQAVAESVRSLSEAKEPEEEADKKASWEARKRGYLSNLSQASPEAWLVACADKIHNLRSMMSAYDHLGDKLWDSFNAPKDKKLWLYGQVLELARKKLSHPIVEELAETYSQARAKLL